MRCLALLQPYPWALVCAGKDIENRTWRFNYRGPVAILASKSTPRSYYETAVAFIRETAPGIEVPRYDELLKGGIVAVTTIVDVIPPTSNPTRRWHMPNQYGYVLEHTLPTKFVPYKGQRGLFEVPASLIEVDYGDLPVRARELRSRIEAYNVGDRPMSPPARLLRELADVESVLSRYRPLREQLSAAPAAPRTQFTLAEWRAEGERRFGKDMMAWRFVCPSCQHVACVEDWNKAGAPEGAVAFSCVGRWQDGGAETERRTADAAFKRNGGPCNYAGGGLFKLNPVTVTMPDEVVRHVFAFAGGHVDVG